MEAGNAFGLGGGGEGAGQGSGVEGSSRGEGDEGGGRGGAVFVLEGLLGGAHGGRGVHDG